MLETMNMIFVIKGDPVPQGRPRFFRRGSFVGTYKPDKDVSYRNLVQIQVKSQAARDRIKLPLTDGGQGFRVEVSVGIRPPASWSEVKRQSAVEGKIRPRSKPDLDNYIKAIFDAFNGVVWEDDSRIIEIRANKHYRTDPSVAVIVTVLDPK